MLPVTTLRAAALLVTIFLANVQHARSQDAEPTGPTMPNIDPSCDAFHTVEEGADESCWSITEQYTISFDDFLTWNPDVSSDCATNFWAGYSYCVGVGDMSTTTSVIVTTSSTELPPSSPTTTTEVSETTSITESYSTRYPITDWNTTATPIETAFPPQRTQPGQPVDCTDWHLVSAADTCDSIAAGSSWMSKQQLLNWNPTLRDDCSGLYVGWWVCVMVRVQSVTDSFSWITTDIPADVPTLPSEYTPTTFPTYTDNMTAYPTQTGMLEGCKSFHLAEAGDTCRDIVDGHYLTEEDFFGWNPALDGNCDGLWAGYRYCIVGPDGITVMPPTVTAAPTSIPSGQTPDCVSWYQSSGESCEVLAAFFGTFSNDEFIAWNPSAESDCVALIDGQWYCVGIPETPTTRTEPIPTREWPETPTQSGIAADCSKLWLVGVYDTCSSIASFNGITEAQLLAWNPAVGTDACDSLVPDFYVCVAIDASVPTTTPTSV